jgi:hypothetical protein
MANSSTDQSYEKMAISNAIRKGLADSYSIGKNVANRTTIGGSN